MIYSATVSLYLAKNRPTAGQQSTISHLKLNDDYVTNIDIPSRHFLIQEFHEIKMFYPFHSQIPSTRPTEHQIDTPVRKASSQFIYTCLSVSFIDSACPTLHLDIILELRPPINHDLPFAELNTLYTLIFSRAKNLDLFLQILGVNKAHGN